MTRRFFTLGGMVKQSYRRRRPRPSPLWPCQIIDVSEYKPRRIPSAKWHKLIKKDGEADPLVYPKSGKAMRIVTWIDNPVVRLDASTPLHLPFPP